MREWLSLHQQCSIRRGFHFVGKTCRHAVSINVTKSLCHGCLLAIFNELISQHGYIDNHTKRQVNIIEVFMLLNFSCKKNATSFSCEHFGWIRCFDEKSLKKHGQLNYAYTVIGCAHRQQT